MGRIKSIDNGESITYEYDSYGQLILETNNILDKTIEYEYNGIGNLLGVTTYPHVNGVASTTGTTVSYSYNTAHPDRLTRVGSNSISYNSMGCITSYNSRIYRWERGKLAGYTRGSMSQPGSPYENCTYTYNALGQRVSKTFTYDLNPAVSNDASYTYTTTYTYDNSGRLIREYTTETHNINGASTRELIYLYDESGVIGVIYYVSGALQGTYYYHRNLLGDVIAIYSANGVKQAEYAYDAFGNCTTIYGANSSIGKYNPIRYRGYYCDIETNWYFLNARYYAPELRRFISPDSTSYIDPESVNGLNLYCYCGNDPVNFVDPSGNMPEWLENVLIGVGIIAITALVVTALTFTGGTAGAFFLAAGKAALVGLKIAATAATVSGLIRTGISLERNISAGNSFLKTMRNAGRSFLAGFGDGFLSGAEYYLSTALISIGIYPFLGLYNEGAGLIKPTYMIGYQNPNVLGITFYASRTGGRFRLDLDPAHSIHYHYGNTKSERSIHKGSWIGGIFVGIYSGFNGVVY